ncbi:MAG: hypothetical protein AOA65_1828 [Candidatus Bathyarchaeota archaeon BA1]|nr:MAG: hypothetical protein AOA65_1828 [Candidatus Bathyarchaeota archaeon BA1]
MSPKKEESTMEEKEPEVFGAEMYIHSAEVLREVGPRVVLSVVAAILIWVFGMLVFIPISQGIYFMGYPVPEVISFILVVAFAIIIFTVFVDIRRLTSGIAGVLAYELGKAREEIRYESYEHYRTALTGVLYVIVVSLAFLLFSRFLTLIHPAIPAVVLIFIVVWAVFALWRSCKAIASEISRSTAKWAKELEKRVKKHSSDSY